MTCSRWMCFAVQHHGQRLLQHEHSLHLSTDQTKSQASLDFFYFAFLFGVLSSIVLNHFSPKPHAFICLFLSFMSRNSVLRVLGFSLFFFPALFSFHARSLHAPPPPVPPQLLPAVVRLIQTSMALPAVAYRSPERQGGRWEERKGRRT